MWFGYCFMNQKIKLVDIIQDKNFLREINRAAIMSYQYNKESGSGAHRWQYCIIKPRLGRCEFRLEIFSNTVHKAQNKDQHQYRKGRFCPLAERITITILDAENLKRKVDAENNDRP